MSLPRRCQSAVPVIFGGRNACFSDEVSPHIEGGLSTMFEHGSNAPVSAVGVDASARRVNGLDSIRFICAFVVMLGHIGLLKDRLHGAGAIGLTKMAIGLFNCLFNGPAAVIVFFIVSGFCIHFPYIGQRVLSVRAFYSRRFIRILPPAMIYFAIQWFALDHRSNPLDTVLWSVICECVYYLAYPAILHVRRKLNLLIVIGGASIVVVPLIATHMNSLNDGSWSYIALGPLTCIVGLPCWLIGCWLAENYTCFSVPSTAHIVLLRLGIYASSVLLALLHNHLDSFVASNCILLDVFAVPACFWVGKEIAYASRHNTIAVLEWAGAWSYSLYLIHSLAHSIVEGLGGPLFQDPRLHFIVPLVALFASYGYFLMVERPSHRLAVVITHRYFAEIRKPLSKIPGGALRSLR